MAAAAACGGGGTVVPPSSLGAQSAATAPDAQRDAALTILKNSEASQRTSQGWGGNNWNSNWSNCPPSGSGSDAWPNGGNWWWDGQTWWHWTNHQWCKDGDHNSNCPGSGATASPKPTSTPISGSSGGGTTVTTTTYDAITGLGLIVAGGITGVLTTGKGGTATAYEPSVNQTLLLAAVNFNATCADPGATTQSSSRTTMAAPTSAPAPTAAPTTLPSTACVIVMYTNGANPVVIGSPLTNDLLNGTLDFLSVSALALTANDTYTFYLAYPVTTTVTTGGGGGSTSGGGSGSSCTTASQNGSNSYWDGSSWWSWFGGQWCHNQTPAPTCTPAPTPTPAPSNNNGGWGGWGWW